MPPSRACPHCGVAVPMGGAGAITALSLWGRWSQAARLRASVPFPGLSLLLLTVSLEGGHLEAPSTAEKLGAYSQEVTEVRPEASLIWLWFPLPLPGETSDFVLIHWAMSHEQCQVKRKMFSVRFS